MIRTARSPTSMHHIINIQRRIERMKKRGGVAGVGDRWRVSVYRVVPLANSPQQYGDDATPLQSSDTHDTSLLYFCQSYDDVMSRKQNWFFLCMRWLYEYVMAYGVLCIYMGVLFRSTSYDFHST